MVMSSFRRRICAMACSGIASTQFWSRIPRGGERAPQQLIQKTVTGRHRANKANLTAKLVSNYLSNSWTDQVRNWRWYRARYLRNFCRSCVSNHCYDCRGLNSGDTQFNLLNENVCAITQKYYVTSRPGTPKMQRISQSEKNVWDFLYSYSSS